MTYRYFCSVCVVVADELEREEFYRLKKVQDKKKKIRKEKEAMQAERKARGNMRWPIHGILNPDPSMF